MVVNQLVSVIMSENVLILHEIEVAYAMDL